MDEVRPKWTISSNVDEDSDTARATNEARRCMDEVRPNGTISCCPCGRWIQVDEDQRKWTNESVRSSYEERGAVG